MATCNQSGLFSFKIWILVLMNILSIRNVFYFNDLHYNGFDAMIESAKMIVSQLKTDPNSDFEVRANRRYKPEASLISILEYFKQTIVMKL